MDSHETYFSKFEENFQGLKTEVGDQIAAASSSLRKIPDNGHYYGQLNNNLGDFASQACYQAAIALSNMLG